MVACAEHTWTLISTERGGGIWTVKVERIWIHDAVIVVVVIIMVVAPPLTSVIFIKRDECLIATPLKFDLYLTPGGFIIMYFPIINNGTRRIFKIQIIFGVRLFIISVLNFFC